MNKLEVFEHRKLVLSKVIVEEHRNLMYSEMEAKINEFENKVRLLNVQSFGPLITKMSGTQISASGMLSVDCDIIIQAHDYEQYGPQFKTFDTLVAHNCLYLRFQDSPQYMHLATSALELYQYNNDIDDSGILYTLLLQGNDESLTVDYFKPVI